MFLCVCKNVLPAYSGAKIIFKKSNQFSQSYGQKCIATFFMKDSV